MLKACGKKNTRFLEHVENRGRYKSWWKSGRLVWSVGKYKMTL
jgi:hypothetical protein